MEYTTSPQKLHRPVPLKDHEQRPHILRTPGKFFARKVPSELGKAKSPVDIAGREK